MVVGITNETRHSVTKQMSPPHLPVVVLSTPAMIGLIEGCCLLAAAPHLDDGEVTVGTHVCVSHDAPVNEGEEFVIRCRLASVEKRRLTFDVEVDGPRGPVSRGTHQRAVLHTARMVSAPTAPARHHSDLTDPQLARLLEVLTGLGEGHPFSATEALTAALSAGVENHLADIDSALSDLEDAGLIRQVQKNPPRWQVIKPVGS